MGVLQGQWYDGCLYWPVFIQARKSRRDGWADQLTRCVERAMGWQVVCGWADQLTRCVERAMGWQAVCGWADQLTRCGKSHGAGRWCVDGLTS